MLEPESTSPTISIAEANASIDALDAGITTRGPLRPVKSLVDGHFFALLARLVRHSLPASLATTQLLKRDWQYPEFWGWTGDPQDIPGQNLAFDRSDANNVYVDALTNKTVPGKNADCAAMKIQVEYIAVAERAFRTRHASRIRCMMHSAGRRLGHGDGNFGLYAGSVLPYIGTLITAAGRDPNS